MNLITWVRRTWSKYTQRNCRDLTRTGDWYLVYPDGQRTYYVSYGDAKMIQKEHSGEIK